MTVYDFLETTKRDYDVADTTFDTEVAVCHIDEEKDNYSRFCNAIIKKVEMVEQVSDIIIVANWTDMIERNMDKFRTFTQEHWRDDCQYEDDDEEFVYQWINEIHNYMAGNVSEDFYGTLLAFVETLE